MLQVSKKQKQHQHKQQKEKTHTHTVDSIRTTYETTAGWN